jgi:hypothetical protein
MVLAFSQTKGFLGTGAAFEADLNLVVQVIMGGGLIAGSFSQDDDATPFTEFARRRCCS